MTRKEKLKDIIGKMMEQSGRSLDEDERCFAEAFSRMDHDEISVWMEPEYGEWFFTFLYEGGAAMEFVTNSADREISWNIGGKCEKTAENEEDNVYEVMDIISWGRFPYEDLEEECESLDRSMHEL